MTLRLNGEEIGGVVEISGQPIGVNIDSYTAEIVNPMPYLHGISHGLVANHVGLNKFGHNSTVGASLEEVWDVSTTPYPWQAAAETMKISSGDVDDQGLLVSSGAATGGSLTTLVDAAANFVGDGVAVGDLVINDTNKEHAIVTGVAAQTLTMALGTTTATAALDTYRVANANDTGAAVTKWYGLDANWNPISEYIIMATAADVGTLQSFLRVNRGKVVLAGSNGTNEGNILAENNASGVAWAQITAEFGQTEMAIWTVPNGNTAHFIKFYATTSTNKVTEIHFRMCEFGQAWQTKRIITLLANSDEFEYDIPLVIPQRTDMAIMASAVGAGGDVSAGFDLYYETN